MCMWVIHFWSPSLSFPSVMPAPHPLMLFFPCSYSHPQWVEPERDSGIPLTTYQWLLRWRGAASSSNHELAKVLQWALEDVLDSFPMQDEMVMGPVLSREPYLSPQCLRDTISQHSSPFSGSYILSAHLSCHPMSLWGVGRDVSFRIEHPRVMGSQHFDQSYWFVLKIQLTH